ncbi:MAG: hypothetical protein ABJA50_04065 [Chloroflexota bacterium]
MRMLNNPQTKSTVITFALLGLITCAHILSKVILGAGLVDDAYIFLRYAHNLASGAGLVFNPGDPVEGYTSPLWTLLMVVPALLHVDLPVSAMILSSLFGLATLFAVFFFCRKHFAPYKGKEWLAVVPPLILATNPSFEFWAWSGMDTSLFTFLFFITFRLFLEQVNDAKLMIGSGLCFFLTAFARLDILALLPVYLFCIFFVTRQSRPLFWRKLISFVSPGLLLALHFVWRYSYYGSWLPNTYYAKVGVPLGVLLQKGLAYTTDFLAAYALYVAITVIIILLLARLSGSMPAARKLGVAITVTWLAYVTYVGGDHFAMFRFYVPILPVLAYIFVSFIPWVIARTATFSPRSHTLIATLLMVGVFLGNFMVYWSHDGERARQEVELAGNWVDVGQWLKDNTPRDSSIASMVIGAISYYSELHTYDLLGLTDKEIAMRGKIYPEGAIGHQKYDTSYILAQKPDYIVYVTSGGSTTPLGRNFTLPPTYFYAFNDLISDPRTEELYDFKEVKMGNGRYIELLQLK